MAWYPQLIRQEKISCQTGGIQGINTSLWLTGTVETTKPKLKSRNLIETNCKTEIKEEKNGQI